VNSFEVVNINLKHKPDWYLKELNPMGKVPTLEMDGKIVYESTVVAEYVDETLDGDKILPKDPYKKAQQKMLTERMGQVNKNGAMFILKIIEYSLFTFMLPSNRIFALNLLIISRCYLRMWQTNNYDFLIFIGI